MHEVGTSRFAILHFKTINEKMDDNIEYDDDKCNGDVGDDDNNSSGGDGDIEDDYDDDLSYGEINIR